MIDETKLIECLAYDMSCFETEDKKVSQLYVRVDDMVRMINGQPKIGAWIPCSERLPEESGFYMVTKKIKETGKRFTGKSRFDIEKGWNDSLNFVDIVAWQPLPEEYHG